MNVAEEAVPEASSPYIELLHAVVHTSTKSLGICFHVYHTVAAYLILFLGKFDEFNYKIMNSTAKMTVFTAISKILAFKFYA